MLRRLLDKLVGRRQYVTADDVRLLIRSNNLKEASSQISHLHPLTPQKDLLKECLLAEIAFRERRDDDAEAGFRRVLSEAPGFAEAHYGLSLVLVEAGQIESALEHAVFAKNLKPEEQRFIAHVGYCYVMMGAYPSAESPLNQALRLDPQDKQSWNNLGIVLRTKGEMAKAKGCFMQALEVDPGYQSAITNMAFLDAELANAGMGVEYSRRNLTIQEPVPAQDLAQSEDDLKTWVEVEALWNSGLRDRALSRGETLCLEHPEDPRHALRMADLYRRAADHDAAIDVLEGQLKTNPGTVDVLAALGEIYLAADRPASAIDPLRKAVATGEARAKVFSDLGTALHARELYAEALDTFRSALELEKTPALQKKLAAALIMSCRYDEAISLYESMLDEGEIRLDEMQGNYASALAYAGRFDEALFHLNRILETQTYDAALTMMRAIIHLLHGRYAQGWDDYSWRHLSYSKDFRTLPFPKWRGEPIAGKRLVVLAEQGLGDQVMFASCLPDLYARGPARLVLEAMDRVAPTLARSFPYCEVVATRQKKDMQWATELGEMDYFVPLADLPAVFRRSASDFPGQAYLAVNPERKRYWQNKLDSLGPGRKVGFSWKGGTQITRTALRTIEPVELAALAGMSGIRWINLQYGPVAAQLSEFKDLGLDIVNWPEAIADLDEFSALIANLDMVVTVCNTTVHYAGAIGRPVLVLAPKVPEWRYGLHNRTMPWYPDVEVCRQTISGSWAEPVDFAMQWINRHALQSDKMDV